MDQTTPLVEVVPYLEGRTAGLLSPLRMDLQDIIVNALRHFMVTLEEDGVTLDPITLGEALHNLASCLVEEFN